MSHHWIAWSCAGACVAFALTLTALAARGRAPEPHEGHSAFQQPSNAPAAPAAGQPVPSWDEKSEHLKGVFEREAADPQWSGPSRSAASDALKAALPPGSSLRSFECRTSICRVETDHPDLIHSQRFVRAAFLVSPPTAQAAWHGESFSTPLDESRALAGLPFTLATYLARKGRLP